RRATGRHWFSAILCTRVRLALHCSRASLTVPPRQRCRSLSQSGSTAREHMTGSKPSPAIRDTSNTGHQPLFRATAVEASVGTQIGEPLTTHWRGVALFTLLAFVLVSALVAFAATTEYSPVNRVPSYVEPRGGLVRLSAPISGHVRELAVAQGASVRRGALL